MSSPAFDYAVMLLIGAASAFLLGLVIAGVFELQARRRPPRYDHFGSRLDD